MPEPRLVSNGPALARSGLVHRVAVPAGPGPYPTVVMLHGRAGTEDNMWVFAEAVPAGTLLVAPRAIYEDADGYGWYPYVRGEWPDRAQLEEAVLVLRRFILALPALYDADLARVSLMGFSQGAALSFALAMRFPHLVRRIAGLVGFVPAPAESAPAGPEPAMDGLPVFMAAGEQDPFIPYERALEDAAALRAAGAALTFRAYAAGHHLPVEGMRDLTEWWGERAA